MSRTNGWGRIMPQEGLARAAGQISDLVRHVALKTLQDYFFLLLDLDAAMPDFISSTIVIDLCYLMNEALYS